MRDKKGTVETIPYGMQQMSVRFRRGGPVWPPAQKPPKETDGGGIRMPRADTPGGVSLRGEEGCGLPRQCAHCLAMTDLRCGAPPKPSLGGHSRVASLAPLGQFTFRWLRSRRMRDENLPRICRIRRSALMRRHSYFVPCKRLSVSKLPDSRLTSAPETENTSQRA